VSVLKNPIGGPIKEQLKDPLEASKEVPMQPVQQAVDTDKGETGLAGVDTVVGAGGRSTPQMQGI